MVTSNSAIPGGLAGLGQLKELRQRLFFVLIALFVFRVATHIPKDVLKRAGVSK